MIYPKIIHRIKLNIIWQNNNRHKHKKTIDTMGDTIAAKLKTQRSHHTFRHIKWSKILRRGGSIIWTWETSLATSRISLKLTCLNISDRGTEICLTLNQVFKGQIKQESWVKTRVIEKLVKSKLSNKKYEIVIKGFILRDHKFRKTNKSYHLFPT